MAVSNNTREKRNKYSEPYTESQKVAKMREIVQDVAKRTPAQSDNSYLGQLAQIYKQISQRPSFLYNPENDKAYQQYAAQYKALGDLAMAQTQQAAEGLTGGYGSTYSADVATQTNEGYQDRVTEALPAYYQMAQEMYNNQGSMLNDKLSTVIDAANRYDNSLKYQNELWNNALSAAGGIANQEAKNEYEARQQLANLWNEQYWNEVDAGNDQKSLEQNSRWSENKLLQNDKEFKSELESTKTENKRDEKWARYESNQSIAAAKCADYNDKGDNKGMKKYLDSLVKNGSLTQYMADQLYSKYKYTAPKSSSKSSPKSSPKWEPTGDEPQGNNGATGDNTVNKIDTETAINSYSRGTRRNYITINGIKVNSIYKNAQTLKEDIQNKYNKGQIDEKTAGELLEYFKLV